jgi:hypothetical protein
MRTIGRNDPCHCGILRQMAELIFTRERIMQLVAGLKKYRAERFAADDQGTATLASGAINCFLREDSPEENGFLLSLCWKSLDSTMNATVAETGLTAS